jgi:hypothetical protein
LWGTKGLALHYTISDRMNIFGADVQPEILASILAKTFESHEGHITIEPKNRGDPKASDGSRGVVVVKVVHFNLHSDCHVIPERT